MVNRLENRMDLPEGFTPFGYLEAVYSATGEELRFKEDNVVGNDIPKPLFYFGIGLLAITAYTALSGGSDTQIGFMDKLQGSVPVYGFVRNLGSGNSTWD